MVKKIVKFASVGALGSVTNITIFAHCRTFWKLTPCKKNLHIIYVVSFEN